MQPLISLVCPARDLDVHALYLQVPTLIGMGWKWRFCKRLRIHILPLQGEIFSANREASEIFSFHVNIYMLVIISSCTLTLYTMFIPHSPTMDICYQHSPPVSDGCGRVPNCHCYDNLHKQAQQER